MRDQVVEKEAVLAKAAAPIYRLLDFSSVRVGSSYSSVLL